MAANPFTEISEKLDALTQMVAEMQRQTKVSLKPVDAPLTVEEAMDYLNLSKSRLYRLTSQRGIPFIKRGQGILFNKPDLDKWLQSKRKKTADEIRQEAKRYRG
ncbi:MAG: helix-turn-helix domain-containing protein [Bacteroidetes bacterium]|nr:MAG: helix-turn-helix domain-containing protein [Bacteroidota bacterium]